MKTLLKDRGFQSFLWTQFLGALNDNLYKMIVSLRAVYVAAQTGQGGEYLSIALGVFSIPFLLFSGYSGYLADRFSKRTVLISVKVFEIGVMLLGVLVFFSSDVRLMLIVLFLMALHSTIFSPAKYGIVPEISGDKDLTRANALLEMTTFVAIILGTAVAGLMFKVWKEEPWKMGFVMVAIAVAGFATSLGITRVAASGAKNQFQWNPLGEVITGTRHLMKDRPLWLTVIGISYFWFLGALFQTDLVVFGSDVLKVDETSIALMVGCLAVGIGIGSMLAGRLSGDKVEIGLVPLGSALMTLSSVALYMSKGSYLMSILCLAVLGIASGLFIVPLNAYLQQRSGSGETGRAIATNNFYNTLGLLLASATLYGLHDKLHLSPATIILLSGALTVAVTVYIVMLAPEFLVRFLLWFATHTIFKIRIVGTENVPRRGPALLVANHMSHVDGMLIGACLQRFVRFMVWKPYYDLKAFHWFFKLTKAIPVGTSGPRDMVRSIQDARAQLKAGHVVCIFAEGAISRTGNLLPFKRGLEKIVEGLDVPVVPVHLDRLWGSIFSFEGGRFFWKWPKRIPYPVTVSFGNPMAAEEAHAHEVRQAIGELASEAVVYRKSKRDLLHVRFVRTARKNWSRFAMADSTGRELTYGRALMGAVLMAGWAKKQNTSTRMSTRHAWRRALQRNGDAPQMIGVLLPSSVGGALANLGITMAGLVPVNLNFTAGAAAMKSAVEQCGIKTILTSRVFLAKAKLDGISAAGAKGGTDGTVHPALGADGAFASDGGRLGTESSVPLFAQTFVFIEDVVKTQSKARAFMMARFAPKWALRAGKTPDSLATVIFSSGSTGNPKGVMLSHYNVLSNIEAMGQVFWLGERDRIVGVLPFFHSFGFTVTIWLPLVSGCGAVYHPNPTDAKAIGELVEKYKGTFLLSTPTFCSGYSRKCTKEQFASLRFVLVGAEKLRESIAKQFEEAFGVELLEGYGCTEMSPVVAVNVPNFEAGRDTQVGNKFGTVGHPLPGVAVRIVDPETMEARGANEAGLLMVKGANRMLGYIGKSAAEDDWYTTGDIAVLDDEGFLRITDRLSRFSKIGGEMVPHLKIEDAIHGACGDAPCAVVGIPDEKKGERLVVLYTQQGMAPEELWKRLADTDLPRLWVPKRENIYCVDCLPTLATGKLDLRGVRARAEELAGAYDGLSV
jgi:acyl-[acyl-carrier-protein]-phospholipid O-acyltransferase/long-chain-fatty-acid--[acyl-carrier-protein] ligase